MSHLLASVLAVHDSARFEAFGVALRPRGGSVVEDAVRNSLHQCVDVAARDVEAIAALMRE